MNAIETQGLTKYYGRARGIIDVSLSVEAGDFFGFIGPNGAGKSTLIRTLLGLISPTSGSATVLGKSIGDIDILKEVGYLPSETVFYNRMKVKDILKLAASIRKTDCTREANILCERLELDVNKKVNELSLGNKKKVGIVCALQHKPSLYILDEPTSGLDPLMQAELYAILKERNEAGATVFLSSHILSEIDKYCKRVAVIRDGRIVASDNIVSLGKAEAKRIVLRGASVLPQIDGIFNVKWENDLVSFLYSGPVDAFIVALSQIKFSDVNISDPDLEETFMHYYTREEQ